MALSELEKKRVERAVAAFMEKRRPPPHVRSQIDRGFRIKGQSVEIFDTRPDWRHPSKTMEQSIAKATYVRTVCLWKVFWMRADLKWHAYDPAPQVGTIEKFLELVDEDRHGCFFG